MSRLGAVFGADFADVLTRLCAVWDGVTREVKTQVVILEGKAGSGKTRQLQLLYEHVVAAADTPQLSALRIEAKPDVSDVDADESPNVTYTPGPQSWLGYWPRSLREQTQPVQEATAHPPGHTRRPQASTHDEDNVIYPGGAWSPPLGSRPGVFWWGLRAEPPSSQAPQSCAALSASGQVNSHLSSIDRALTAGDDLTQARIRAALDVSCWTQALFGLAVPALGGAAILGAGLSLASAAKDARQAAAGLKVLFSTRAGLLEEALKAPRLRELDLTLGARALASAEETGRVLNHVAAVLPVVIVVDDAQHLDQATLQLLTGFLAASGSTGLVVLAIDSDVQVSQTDCVQHWIKTQTGRGAIKLTIPPLTVDEMTDLARHLLPGIDLSSERLAPVIAAAAGRPGVLVDLLDQSLIRDALTTGAQLPDHVAPRDRVNRVMHQLTQLPAAIRRTLSVLAVTGQTVWVPWLDGLGVTPDDLQAAAASRWITHDRDVASFITPEAAWAARRLAADELLPAAQTAIRGHIQELAIQASEARSLDLLPPAAIEAHLQELTGADVFTGTLEQLTLVAELARLRAASGRDRLDSTLLEKIRARLTDGAALPLAVVTTAEALMRAHDAKNAIDVLHAEYERLANKYGADNPAALPPLTNLASAWTAIAQSDIANTPAVDRAVELLQLVLQLRHRKLRSGTSLPVTIPDTRDKLASLLYTAGRYAEAVIEGQINVTEHDACSEYGLDHPHTLTARSDLAAYLNAAERAGEALPIAEQVLVDRERILGPDHPNTLIARNNLAGYLNAAGRAGRALPVAEQAFADFERVLGPDHPDTLTARSNLALYLTAAGRTGRALPMTEQVLVDRERVLGPDHPDTLIARSNLAGCLTAAGRTGEALPIAEQVLAYRERVLGPNHPDTLLARSNLAGYLIAARRTGRASTLFSDSGTRPPSKP